MASKKIEMYSEKKFELEEIRDRIKAECNKHMFTDVEFVDEIYRELGDTKTLLLIYERWYLRTGSYASLVIMLSEFKGYQSADIISTGGRDDFISWGAEGNFAKWGEETLRNIGFLSKV